jgi:hypothetical protein
MNERTALPHLPDEKAELPDKVSTGSSTLFQSKDRLLSVSPSREISFFRQKAFILF